MITLKESGGILVLSFHESVASRGEVTATRPADAKEESASSAGWLRRDGGEGKAALRSCRRKLKNPGKKDAGGRADCRVFNLTFSSF